MLPPDGLSFPTPTSIGISNFTFAISNLDGELLYTATLSGVAEIADETLTEGFIQLDGTVDGAERSRVRLLALTFDGLLNVFGVAKFRVRE